MESADKELAGGFSTLSMRASRPEYGEQGSVNVTLQPSHKVMDSGVFVNINCHLSADGRPTKELVEDLHGKFDNCIDTSRKILTDLIKAGRSL